MIGYIAIESYIVSTEKLLKIAHRKYLDLQMTEDLKKLIEKAKRLPMSEEQLKEHRRSFVYGNTKIENNRITRELVDRIDEKLSG